MCPISTATRRTPSPEKPLPAERGPEGRGALHYLDQGHVHPRVRRLCSPRQQHHQGHAPRLAHCLRLRWLQWIFLMALLVFLLVCRRILPSPEERLVFVDLCVHFVDISVLEILYVEDVAEEKKSWSRRLEPEP